MGSTARGGKPKATGLLTSEFRAFGGKHLIFGGTDVAAYAILFDGVHDNFVSELITADKELDRFVDRSILLLETIVVDLNRNGVLVALRICLQQGELNVGYPLERLFRLLVDVEFKVIPFTLLSQRREFR